MKYKINKVRELTNAQLEGLLQIFTQKEIADIFGCATSMISKEMTSRDIFSVKESNKLLYEGIPVSKTVGAWMFSKERLLIKNTKI